MIVGDVVFLLVVWGAPGLFLGIGLSYAFGTSFGRVAAVALLGVVVAGGVFALAYFSTPPGEDCRECTEVLGRSMSPIFALGFSPRTSSRG